MKRPLTLPGGRTAALFIDLQEEHRQDRRLEVCDRFGRAEEGVAEALLRLRHVHAERRVETAVRCVPGRCGSRGPGAGDPHLSIGSHSSVGPPFFSPTPMQICGKSSRKTFVKC